MLLNSVLFFQRRPMCSWKSRASVPLIQISDKPKNFEKFLEKPLSPVQCWDVIFFTGQKQHWKREGERRGSENFKVFQGSSLRLKVRSPVVGRLDAPIINRADLNRGRAKGSLWKIKIWVCHAWRTRAKWRNVKPTCTSGDLSFRVIFQSSYCDFDSLINVYVESFPMA